MLDVLLHWVDSLWGFFGNRLGRGAREGALDRSRWLARSRHPREDLSRHSSLGESWFYLKQNSAWEVFLLRRLFVSGGSNF